jgi:hypothetical protein
VRDITRCFLMYVVLPVWLAAGIADWICHRRQHRGPDWPEGVADAFTDARRSVSSRAVSACSWRSRRRPGSDDGRFSYTLLDRRHLSPTNSITHVPQRGRIARCTAFWKWFRQRQPPSSRSCTGRRCSRCLASAAGARIWASVPNSGRYLGVTRQECWRCRFSSNGCLISKSCCGRQRAHPLQNWPLTGSDNRYSRAAPTSP